MNFVQSFLDISRQEQDKLSLKFNSVSAHFPLHITVEESPNSVLPGLALSKLPLSWNTGLQNRNNTGNWEPKSPKEKHSTADYPQWIVEQHNIHEWIRAVLRSNFSD